MRHAVILEYVSYDIQGFQKLIYRLYEQGGLFLVRHVTGLMDNHQWCNWQFICQADGLLGWDNFINIASDNQCGQAASIQLTGEARRLDGKVQGKRRC